MSKQAKIGAHSADKSPSARSSSAEIGLTGTVEEPGMDWIASHAVGGAGHTRGRTRCAVDCHAVSESNHSIACRKFLSAYAAADRAR
jgi:hypothetical protein